MKPRDPFYLDYFVHPVPLMAVALMAFNDHYLKYIYPSPFTHKLSDFLGLFFFPLLLSAIAMLSANCLTKFIRKNPLLLDRKLLLSCILISSTLFVGVKLSEPLRETLTVFFYKIRYPIFIADDKTDLMALVSNIPCYLFGKKFFERQAVR
jgi:hypothetical protein